ncbi:hypothetical protein FRC18_007740, partial [Serendipita sp. 400]
GDTYAASADGSLHQHLRTRLAYISAAKLDNSRPSTPTLSSLSSHHFLTTFLPHHVGPYKRQPLPLPCEHTCNPHFCSCVCAHARRSYLPSGQSTSPFHARLDHRDRLASGRVRPQVKSSSPLLSCLLFCSSLSPPDRKVAIDHDPQMWSYVTSQVCIVVSPAFVAAQCYMIVGRMMSYVGPESTFISHTVITKLFVILDIVCVLTQSVGVTVLSGSDNPTKSQVTTGRAILIGGLLVQVASFGVFVIVAILFDLKSRKLWGATHSALVRLRPLFLVFYISSILIIGRSIFRTVEFATIDFDKEAQGYLFNNEWPFYVLDSIPVLIATVVFNIVNPSAYLPRKKGLRMDGSHELPRKHWWSREIKTARSEEQMLGERA